MSQTLSVEAPVKDHSHCAGCGQRSRAAGPYCRTCKSKLHHMFQHADEMGWVVDWIGGGFWVWDKHGFVLGMGDTKFQALTAAEEKVG